VPQLTDQYRDASNLNARITLHQRFSTNNTPWQRWVFDHFSLTGCGDILDLGCGPGDLWVENSDWIPRDWAVTLSDLSPGMVETARHNLGNSCHHRFTYGVLDAQAIPFPDRHFNIVIANHMMYHVPDRDELLYEVYRVLQPGGRLYATTNGREHLQELHELVASFCPQAETTNVATQFGLENGAAQLSRHFDRVTRHRQENALLVTEAEPLIAYVRSMVCQPALGQNLEALSLAIREQIAAQGAIHIQKDSGLFVATKD
jgi:ubiquinone/menaquinone biosynthesis C-methylase UbiE